MGLLVWFCFTVHQNCEKIQTFSTTLSDIYSHGIFLALRSQTKPKQNLPLLISTSTPSSHPSAVSTLSLSPTLPKDSTTWTKHHNQNKLSSRSLALTLRNLPVAIRRKIKALRNRSFHRNFASFGFAAICFVCCLSLRRWFSWPGGPPRL